MKKSANHLFSGASVVTDHFKFISFVAPSRETTEEVVHKSDFHGKISGAEASQFYEEVLAIPSTSTNYQNNIKKENKMKKKNVILDNSRLTIFHYAQNGNIQGIEYLLSKHCHIDKQDAYGWTPLMCASFEGHYAVVEYLLKKGAKVNVKNKQGLSAVDIAIKQNHKMLIDLFKNGVIDSKCNSSKGTEEVVKFCKLCNVSYVESVSVHERSIAHLFSRQNYDVPTYYHIPENNKGFQIMLKKGWDRNKGLGLESKGRKFPIKTVLKTDRTCIGAKKEVPKVTHYGPNDYNSVKKTAHTTLNLKRENKLKKSELKKIEKRNRALEINFRRQFLSE